MWCSKTPLPPFVRDDKDAVAFFFNKFLKAGQLDALLTRLGAEKGDCVFIISDKTSKALPILGALRLMVAKELDIIPKGKWNFLWITEMPFFEQDEETGEWIAMHHPFTMPMSIASRSSPMPIPPWGGAAY